MVKLVSVCKRGPWPQGMAVDYCYLFCWQCLRIKYLFTIKKVYLVNDCHYETKPKVTINIFEFLLVRCWSPGSLGKKWPLVKEQNDWKSVVYKYMKIMGMLLLFTHISNHIYDDSVNLAVNVQSVWYHKLMSGNIWIAIKLQNWPQKPSSYTIMISWH